MPVISYRRRKKKRNDPFDLWIFLLGFGRIIMASSFFELNDVVGNKAIDSDGTIEARFARIEMETESSAQKALRDAQNEIERLKLELTNKNTRESQAKNDKYKNSHGLNCKGEIKFAYSGKAPWHGLGVSMATAMRMADALRISGVGSLTFRKELIRAFGANLGYAIVSNVDDIAIGDVVVGKNYSFLQYSEVFSIFEKLGNVETMGALDNGARAFAALERKPIEINGNDGIEKFYVIIDELTGVKPTLIFPSAIRPVCQNTVGHAVAAIGESNCFRIKHTRLQEKRLTIASEILQSSELAWAQMLDGFRKLAKRDVSAREAREYAEALFPQRNKENSDFTTQAKNSQKRIIELFEGGPGASQAGSTAWGLYNAATHYSDWERRLNGDVKVGDRWFSSLETNSDFTNNAAQIALRLVIAA